MLESKEKKEPATPLPSQEVLEEPVYQLPSTADALMQSMQEIYFKTLYTQKASQTTKLYLLDSNIVLVEAGGCHEAYV